MREGTDAEDLTVERQVSMRYKGQGWEIPVRLDDGDFDELASELLASKFTKAYEEFFGRAIDDLTIEAVSWSVRVSSIVEPPEAVELDDASSEAAEASGERPMFDPIAKEMVATAIVDRSAMLPGLSVDGPAVIIEEQTTTVLGTHHRCVMQVDGSLLIRRQGASK